MFLPIIIAILSGMLVFNLLEIITIMFGVIVNVWNKNDKPITMNITRQAYVISMSVTGLVASLLYL